MAGWFSRRQTRTPPTRRKRARLTLELLEARDLLSGGMNDDTLAPMPDAALQMADDTMVVALLPDPAVNGEIPPLDLDQPVEDLVLTQDDSGDEGTALQITEFDAYIEE